MHPLYSRHGHSAYTALGFDWLSRIVDVFFRCRCAGKEKSNFIVFEYEREREKQKFESTKKQSTDEISLSYCKHLHWEMVKRERIVIVKVQLWAILPVVFLANRCGCWMSQRDADAGDKGERERWFHDLQVEREVKNCMRKTCKYSALSEQIDFFLFVWCVNSQGQCQIPYHF